MAQPDTEKLSKLFPLANPIPSPLQDDYLIPSEHLQTEHELAKNPTNLAHWFQYINAVHEEIRRQRIQERGQSSDSDDETLLGSYLSTSSGRKEYRRLVYIYESALAHCPTSFQLWSSYISFRDLYILGPPAKDQKLNLARPRKKRREANNLEEDPPMLAYLRSGSLDESERDVDGGWQSGLDGSIGWKEWRSLAAVHERFITWHPKMPRAWLSYLNMFFHPKCPSFLSHSHARRTFDRALRSLPYSLHERIWPLYLSWAKNMGGQTVRHVFRRYIKIDPALTEYYISILTPEHLNNKPNPSALEAAKIALRLSRLAASGKYRSVEGRSPLDLLVLVMEIAERWPDQVGLDLEDVQDDEQKQENKSESESEKQEHKETTSATTDLDIDPQNSTKLNMEKIIKKDGLDIYKDQGGRLWTGLATFWIKKGEFERAKDTFEKGMAQVLTIRDFTQIFDAYAEFSESYVSSLMDDVTEAQEEAETEGGGKDEDLVEMEKELDQKMKEFEELMDRRPFLVNDVLLRRNPNDVQEWEKRITLCGTDDEQVSKTYQDAIKAINPRKATGYLHQLYISYAKFFENGGVNPDPESRAEQDLASANKIFEKAVQVPFKRVDDLAEVWCEWAEMQVRNDQFEKALEIMDRASTLPKDTKISFHDENLPAQVRLFKSLKLWAFFLDLRESLDTIENTKEAYDQVFRLKIANAQIVINFANFLEENELYEESFKVYERGTELFTFPVVFEIYNTYLSKFIKHYGGQRLERARDLFEQALEKCPPKYSKPIYLLYGKLEEDYGLAKRALNVYERATEAVEPKDKFEMYEILIAKAVSNFGLSAARPIYQKAIESLPDKQTAEMCVRFAALERKLGEIDRARAIYAHASQFCDPRTNPDFWNTWNEFEIQTGSEDTFREMLRIKRVALAAFNTEANYMANKANVNNIPAQANGSASPPPTNAMAALEADASAPQGFVRATDSEAMAKNGSSAPPNNEAEEQEQEQDQNANEIHIDED